MLRLPQVEALAPVVPDKCIRGEHAGPAVGASSNQYSLPFERKRNLCSILVFLSCAEDNPGRIPALCLHESTT
jgi:hypothetical protein